MKVLVFVKATPRSETGIASGPEITKMFEEMGKFNEKLDFHVVILQLNRMLPER